MALSGRELLLIVRAQNQASSALRRVAGDMQRLGTIRDMHFKQNQLAINQSNIMRQRQRALNELQSIENAQGARNLSFQRRNASNMASQIQATQQLTRARSNYMKAVRAGVAGEALQSRAQDVQKYEQRLRAATVGAQQLSAAEAEAAQRASILRSEIGTANQRLAQNAYQMNQIGKAIRAQRWGQLRTAASMFTHLGRVMQMGGLVMGAGLGILAHSAAQYNTEVTLAATQTGKLGSGFQRIGVNSRYLSAALLQVMKDSTASRQEITQSAYDIYSSLNISLGGGVKLLKTFSRASIAGMTPLNDVTQAGITVMNDFGIKVSQMPKVMQRMFAAVRFGRMTFAEFVGTMSQTVPAFAAAGQSFDTLAGAMAFLTRRMPNVRMAGTALARMMEIMGRKEFVKGAKEFGVRITDVHDRLLPLPQVIDKLITRFPKLKTGGTFLQNFFKMITAGKDEKGGLTGTIQARRAFTFLVLGQKAYHDIAGKTVKDNNEFSRSFAAMSRTAGVRWNIFLNRIKAFALALGASILPALLKLSKPIEQLTNWFTNLSKAQRDTFAKYATYAAAFLLVGGTIISVGGMIVKFIAILGELGIAGFGISVILLGIVAAVKVLRGEWQSLGDVVTSFSDTMLGSLKGFVAMSALVSVAALRLSKAAKSLAAAQLMGGAAAGGGGVLRGTLAALATGAVGARVFRAEGAGRLTAALKGAGVAAAAIPGPIYVAAAAIGVAAAAAGLWKLHMMGVEKHSERIARFQAQVSALGQAPVTQARQFGGLGMSVRDVLRQRVAVQDLNAQIKTTRQQIAAANAQEKPALQRQLTLLTLDRADAIDSLRKANAKSNASFNSLTGFITHQRTAMQALGNEQLALRRNRQELQQIYQKILENPTTAMAYTTRIQQLNEGIKNLKGSVRSLSGDLSRNAVIMRSQFVRAIHDLQTAGQLPQKIKPLAIDAMLQAAVRKRRALTIPEMKMVIRAVADPGSIRRIPRDIQAAIRTARINIRISAQKNEISKSISKVMASVQKITFQPKVSKATKSANAVRSDVAKVFSKTIKQHVNVPMQPAQAQAVALGAAITSGVQAGINPSAIAATMAAAVNTAIAAGMAAAKAKSPSKETRDKIGIPLMQGINVGILSQMGLLEKTSRLAVDFFNGPWLTSNKFTDSKKKVHIHVRDIIKDLRMQVQQFRVFNRSLATLGRRGVPLAMLDQLSQLGVEGSKKIAMLANATRKQLRIYVRLWKQAMQEIRKSNRSNFDTIVSDLHNFVDQAAHTLLDKWNEIHDNLTGTWNDIFQGFDDKIGDGFKSAMESWQSGIDDLTQQIADDNQQILDLQQQMTDKVTEEFGQLFQGAYLASQQVQNKIDWGIALNMDDLTKDLQSQLDAFNAWRGDLANLAGKIPADMLKELMDLGPQAAGMIRTLATASGPELDQYVALWQQKQAAIKAAVGDALPDKEEFQKQINTIVGQIAKLMQQINEALAQKPKALTPEDLIAQITGQAKDAKTAFGLIDALRKKGLPDALIQQLAQMGVDALPILQALNTMTTGQLKEYVGIWNKMQTDINTETKKQMDAQIALWKQHGADIAAGIIAGVMSEQEALLKFFRKLFLNLLAAARKQTKSNSPSQVFKSLGSDMVSGLALGLAEGNNLKMPTPSLGNAYMKKQGYNTNTPAPVQMTVNAHHTESLGTTLERAAFRLRNRRV